MATATPTKTKPKKEKPAVEVKKEVKEVVATVMPTINYHQADDIISDEDLNREIAESLKNSAKNPDRYFEAVGRRKTAAARVRMFTKGDKEFIVNGKSYTEYFVNPQDQESAIASMKKMKCLDKFRITVIVKGGGHSAQAEAIRHGTARVLVEFNENFRKRLRKAGFLTRDPRERERKKFGLKRARKGPQWAKR